MNLPALAVPGLPTLSQRCWLQRQEVRTSSAARAKQPGSTSASTAVPSAANGHVHSFDLAAGPQHLQEQEQAHEQGPAQQRQQQPQQEPTGGAKQSKYESLDFELIENTVYRTDAAARTHLDHIMEGGVKWSICFALGEAQEVTRHSGHSARQTSIASTACAGWERSVEAALASPAASPQQLPVED